MGFVTAYSSPGLVATAQWNLTPGAKSLLASGVIAALEWTAEHPSHHVLAKRLRTVAVNLKNLG